MPFSPLTGAAGTVYNHFAAELMCLHDSDPVLRGVHFEKQVSATSKLPGLLLVSVLLGTSIAPAAVSRAEAGGLRVGVAGSEPFVVKTAGGFEGISVEVWQALAAEAGWRYRFQPFESVPEAMEALDAGQIDVVVGPVSITSERAQTARFSQPYYASSLAILSRTESPTWWDRISPFFSRTFFIAVAVLLSVLALVGSLIWLAERRVRDATFAHEPVRGIANGIWLAIVTMSTVGYGDLAPRTFLGRLVTAIWIVISVIMATSLVAGIASTLTLTGMTTNTITTAEELRGREVAVLSGSPGESFARNYGAKVSGVDSLAKAYQLIEAKTVDAIVFDRPQLQYFLAQQHNRSLAVSRAEYMPQNYGFAMPLSAPAIVHKMNLYLLQLEESGRVDRIVRAWLGSEKD